MQSGRTYLLAGGGTGGHLYPGIAVAHALRSAEPEARVIFLTTNRDLDADLVSREGFEQIPQPVRPFAGNPLRWPTFWNAWRASVRQAARAIHKSAAAAVLGLGGYAAGPPVVAAKYAGVRRAILNPDAVPGRANRFLARRVQAVFLQWEASRRHFTPAVECRTVGCPIRAAFRNADRQRGLSRFGLDAAKRTLLVTGASQGARTINEALQRVWPRFARARADWQLLHLTGHRDEAATRSAYERAGAADSATVVGFTHEMADALAAADIVISRAGASTLAELT
ncbi:MAG: UDP-N-acetylglucosamine--N-acetylmuramyl-(pentapeptide) pyrophosphoryl-undecaprenol N-acetylglucosamine transferase, partial [Planctomycetota bacterium]